MKTNSLSERSRRRPSRQLGSGSLCGAGRSLSPRLRPSFRSWVFSGQAKGHKEHAFRSAVAEFEPRHVRRVAHLQELTRRAGRRGRLDRYRSVVVVALDPREAYSACLPRRPSTARCSPSGRESGSAYPADAGWTAALDHLGLVFGRRACLRRPRPERRAPDQAGTESWAA